MVEGEIKPTTPPIPWLFFGKMQYVQIAGIEPITKGLKRRSWAYLQANNTLIEVADFLHELPLEAEVVVRDSVNCHVRWVSVQREVKSGPATPNVRVKPTAEAGSVSLG